ncbi:MAG TPA: type IV pilus secretin PilQ, partial [Gammaproteobacteria bacterium]|nr:type IV pilus secretin PilQ [Gammaproteobacteria bacterium]
LRQIRALVEELDVPVRQVLIESRVVLATDDFSHELGARFGISKGYDDDTVGDGTQTGVSGDSTSADTIAVGGGTPSQPGRFNVDLPVTNLAASAGSIGLAIAKLPLGTILDLELSAAQAEGRSETISTPRVITANQQEASIEQGAEIPYQEAAGDGATSVSFKKAVLSLKVTPQITPDDKIIMDLQVNKDSPDFGNAVQGQPPINTQNVSTRVLVANGETLVLGGVYERDKANQVSRVPFFGDLPVVGHLFRSKFQQDNKSELLIFVTPKIINEGASLQQ